MDSLAVVLKEGYDLPNDTTTLEMRVAFPKDVLCARLHVQREVTYAVPKRIYLRELARKISHEIEGQILDALKRTGVA